MREEAHPLKEDQVGNTLQVTSGLETGDIDPKCRS